MRKGRGPQHYATALALNDLATAYIASGEFEKALSTLEEVIALHRAALGDTHPELATALENLANVLFQLKRQAEAIVKLEEVLAIRRKAFGEDSMPVARTMFNLGTVYSSTKNLDKAEQTLPEGVARLERALGAKHPDLITAYRSLSGAAGSAGPMGRGRGAHAPVARARARHGWPGSRQHRQLARAPRAHADRREAVRKRRSSICSARATSARRCSVLTRGRLRKRSPCSTSCMRRGASRRRRRRSRVGRASDERAPTGDRTGRVVLPSDVRHNADGMKTPLSPPR